MTNMDSKAVLSVYTTWMDDTGVPLEPRPPKVVARKGQKKVRYRTSGQKAQITVLGCANAAGQILPPLIIFAAKQLNPLWTRSEVPGSRYGVSDKGWVDQELFHIWQKEHFLSNAVAQRPLLLLLDGHSSHFKPQCIQFAKDNQIIIFCLSPQTTHECQPLDVGLFGPLKQYWQQACHSFYQKSTTQVISKYFCQVFKDAWLNAVVPTNVCAGFEKAGVYPFNPNAVSATNSLRTMIRTPTMVTVSSTHVRMYIATISQHSEPETNTEGEGNLGQSTCIHVITCFIFN